MNKSKTSIKAIIFVMIYVLFIFFISLFHGISFYNLKIHNVKIQKIFIKLHKKLILKANNITIIPQQKVSKDIINFHKQIYFISKIIPIFEKLDINNLKYRNLKIKTISYKNKKILVKSSWINIKGNLAIYKNFTLFENFIIKISNYRINNINGIIKYSKENLKFNLTGKINSSSFKLKGILTSNDVIKASLTSNKISLQINNYSIISKNLMLKSHINIHYPLKSYIFLNSNHMKINNYELHDLYIKYKNQTIFFKIGKIRIPILKNFKNIVLDNIKGSYYPKERMLISNNHMLSFVYKNAKFNLTNNSLIFVNKNNFNFTSKKISITYKKYKTFSKDIFVLKFNKFLLIKAQNNIIKNNLLQIYNDLIYIKNKLIEIPRINVKYKKIHAKILNTLINYKSKKAIIEKIYLSNFLFSPTFINLYNNYINIYTHSNNITINQDLKTILKTFNINLPITQLKGKNFTSINIKYNIQSKKLLFDSNITSINSTYQIYDTNFSYKHSFTEINNTIAKSTIKNLHLKYDFLSLHSDLNLSLYLQKKYINSNSFIKNFKIFNFLNIRNFPEKVVLDLNNSILYLLNSCVIFNIKSKELFLLKIKKLIKYTPFSKLIKDGGIYIKISNPLLISGTINLLKPLILNQKDPNLLNLSLIIRKNNINIQNNYIDLNIENLTKYTAIIRNADINIKNLINYYKILSILLSNNQKNNIKKPFLYIIAKNTNFIYGSHKFLSQEAYLIYKNNELKIYSKYKKSILLGYTKKHYFLLEGKNYHKEELEALLSFFKNFSSITLDFTLIKSPENFYTGKVFIKKGIVKELKTLNNIIAFLNTIPALLSLSSPGFSSKGYKIKEGIISYLFYKNILYLKRIKIIGKNIDFYGKGYIDLKTNKINLKITAKLKIKLKKIPIIGKTISYILFGKDGNIDVKILVKGDLNNPKVSQDIGKSILLSPFEIFKRVITLPFNIF